MQIAARRVPGCRRGHPEHCNSGDQCTLAVWGFSIGRTLAGKPRAGKRISYWLSLRHGLATRPVRLLARRMKYNPSVACRANRFVAIHTVLCSIGLRPVSRPIRMGKTVDSRALNVSYCTFDVCYNTQSGSSGVRIKRVVATWRVSGGTISSSCSPSSMWP